MIAFFLLGVASNVNILMGRSWGHGASIPNSVFPRVECFSDLLGFNHTVTKF